MFTIHVFRQKKNETLRGIWTVRIIAQVAPETTPKCRSTSTGLAIRWRTRRGETILSYLGKALTEIEITKITGIHVTQDFQKLILGYFGNQLR